VKIDELVSLTNGLSVPVGQQMLVCDRARIGPVTDTTVDMSFWLVGTDLVPRLTLPRARLALGTPDEIAALVRVVARGALTGERHPRR
jgi:hypothetical protein